MTLGGFLRSALTAVFVAGLAGRCDAQSVSPLNGVWTLNRSLSQAPAEIGFNTAWIPSAGGGGGDRSTGSGGGGGRGGRGSGRGGGGGRQPAGPFATSYQSYDDARRVQLLTAEARNPAVRLMIVDTPDAVTITNELGQSRVLHPSDKEESIEIQGVPFRVTTKRRDGGALVVVYHVEQGRDVRYTYSRSMTPPQLVVELQFLEHGAGDTARRVYELSFGNETTSSAAPAAPSGTPAVPASPGSRAADTFDARPGAELRGLKGLGILIEDLSTQAVACGLNHDALETSLAKRLTEGGFSVRKNSDDDTYVYVNVMTTTISTGACVSRYDAFLYTHATANLSYRDQPVLVQVSLMHRGGMTSGPPGAHAVSVGRGLEGYIDLIVSQIRDANK